MIPIRFRVLVLLLSAACCGWSGLFSFSNVNSITIPDSGTAGLYPSDISVSGVGVISSLTVSLYGLSHTYPDDIDVLLVGPTGANAILMSDVGGGSDAVGVNLTFDDAAAVSLPDSALITSGTYLPTNIATGDTFSSPAPAGPYGSTLASFVGTDPTGTWALYVMDHAGGDTGSISGGWSLDITTADEVPEPGTALLLLGGLAALSLLRRRRAAK